EGSGTPRKGNVPGDSEWQLVACAHTELSPLWVVVRSPIVRPCRGRHHSSNGWGERPPLPRMGNPRRSIPAGPPPLSKRQATRCFAAHIRQGAAQNAIYQRVREQGGGRTCPRLGGSFKPDSSAMRLPGFTAFVQDCSHDRTSGRGEGATGV